MSGYPDRDSVGVHRFTARTSPKTPCTTLGLTFPCSRSRPLDPLIIAPSGLSLLPGGFRAIFGVFFASGVCSVGVLCELGRSGTWAFHPAGHQSGTVFLGSDMLVGDPHSPYRLLGVRIIIIKGIRTQRLHLTLSSNKNQLVASSTMQTPRDEDVHQPVIEKAVLHLPG